jgi:hypothetical protein
MHSFRKRRRGAALIEFAFVGILFLGLLFAMIQYGIYLSVTNALWNLSREGARYASVQVADPNNGTANNQAIVDHVKKLAPSIIDTSKMVVSIDPPSTKERGQGDIVEVKIAYDMTGKILFRLGGKPAFVTPGDTSNQLALKEVKNAYVTSTKMMVER